MDGSVLQKLIDEAGPESVIAVPPDTYEVDAVNAPISPRSTMMLDLTGSTLQAKPNDQKSSKIIRIRGVDDVTVLNGTVIGERDTHLASTVWSEGGWGHGISIEGGSRNPVVRGTKISRCFADGIYVHDAYDVRIEQVISSGNRRQGMSVIHCDGIKVIKSQFDNIGGVFPGSAKKNGINGTPPGCGIDFECDDDSMRIANVVVDGCVFYENSGACLAFGSPGQYRNIKVLNNNGFDMKTQPIWAAGNAGPLGTPWWAFLLNRTLGTTSGYRWWGYRTEWSKA